MIQKEQINMEYEARAMIDEKQYSLIVKHFKKSKLPERKITNINTYFDYENLYLTEHHMVLRIRETSDKLYELTLKVKGENGDIEINQPLTYIQVKENKKRLVIDSKEILNELNKREIDINKLNVVAELKTERLELKEKDHLIVIDKNYYNGKVDYNVEVESDSKIHAKQQLIVDFSPFGVEYKNGYISKSRRAIYKL